jgi:hypothetical protein
MTDLYIYKLCMGIDHIEPDDGDREYPRKVGF